MATQWKLRTIVAAVGMALVAPVVVAKTTGQAQATASSSQMAAGSFDFTKGSINSATINRHVLQNAKGNIGVNIAGGNGNMQVNNTDVALADGALTKKTSASSLVENTQWGNIFSLSLSKDVTNNAQASNHVLQNATGNIGLNVAAGADNMQASNNLEANRVIIARSLHRLSLDQLTHIAPPIHQINHTSLSASPAGRRTVTVADNALKGVTGIAQVSQAAGSGNSLSNSVTLNLSAGMR